MRWILKTLRGLDYADKVIVALIGICSLALLTILGLRLFGFAFNAYHAVGTVSISYGVLSLAILTGDWFRKHPMNQKMERPPPRQQFRRLVVKRLVVLLVGTGLSLIVGTGLCGSEGLRGPILFSRDDDHAYLWQVLAMLAIIIPADLYALGCLQQVRIFCPGCGKYISSRETWVCGYCDKENDPDWGHWYCFLNKCKRCKQPPAVYECHRCGTMVPLGEKKDASHPARQPTRRIAGESDGELERRKKKEKEDREHQILITRLDSDLAEAKLKLKVLQQKSGNIIPKPYEERLENDLAKKKGEEFALDDIYSREKTAAAERYKNDSERLERFVYWLDSWRDKHLLHE